MAVTFYVYEIIRDGRVVYVGKGCGKRYKRSEKERGGVAFIVGEFALEADAYAFERKLIAERLAQGCRLLNVSHGQRVPWNRRKDTQAFAREVLEEFAGRFARWIAVGRGEELSSRIGIPHQELVSLVQRFGV